MQDIDTVVEQIGEILRPHCDLSEAELARVSETVLLLGARHALRWVESNGEATADASDQRLAYAERD